MPALSHSFPASLPLPPRLLLNVGAAHGCDRSTSRSIHHYAGTVGAAAGGNRGPTAHPGPRSRDEATP